MKCSLFFGFSSQFFLACTQQRTLEHLTCTRNLGEIEMNHSKTLSSNMLRFWWQGNKAVRMHVKQTVVVCVLQYTIQRTINTVRTGNTSLFHSMINT